MRFLCFALLGIALVSANVRLRQSRHARPEDDMAAPLSEQYVPPLHDWLTAEQKAILEPVRGDPVQFKEKVQEFYKLLDAEKRKVWDEKYRQECNTWLSQHLSSEELADLKTLEYTDRKAAKEKKKEYEGRLNDVGKKMVNLWREECDKLNEEASRKRRELGNGFDDDSMQMVFEVYSRVSRSTEPADDFISWMTDDQKKQMGELKAAGKSLAEQRDKAMDFFNQLSGDKRTELRESYKGKCKAYFVKIGTAEELADLKKAHEAGNAKEVDDQIKALIGRQEGDEKVTASKMSSICREVFQGDKKKRDVKQKIEQHLSWLTEEQQDEIKSMVDSGVPRHEVKEKLFKYLSSVDSTTKNTAKEETRKKCYAWMEEVATKEEIEKLHKLHEVDHDACKTTVREYIKRLPTERQAKVNEDLPFCEKVWYGSHDHSNHENHHKHHARNVQRRRRHLSAIEEYIKWLSPEDKEIVHKMEQSGADFDEIVDKIKEIYKSQPEPLQVELKANFKNTCYAWVKSVATPEELAELKTLKENGDVLKLKEKVASLEGKLDSIQKHTVEHTKDLCYSVWEMKESRKRRDHSHNLEEAFGKYLSWTTEAQRDELRKLKEAGNREAIYEKVMEYFESAQGETKTKAAEELKDACKHFAVDLFGESGVTQIKELKEAGASHDDIAAKVKSLVDSLTDATKKSKAQKFTAACDKIYRSLSRKRRDHQHTLETAIDKYLTWTTEEQRTELRTLEKNGDKDGIEKKIMEFFEATEGETKQKAAEELKEACKHYATDLFGEAGLAQIKAVKESGGSHDDIAAKVQSLIDGITDDEKKGRAQKLSTSCGKLYRSFSRKRRDHHHSLEDFIDKYLSWTTEEQKNELRDLKTQSEDKEAMYKKVMEFFASTEGETKQKAAEQLKGACKHYATDLFGEAGVAQIKAAKESGASKEAMIETITELINGLPDETKKDKAQKLTAGCQKVYEAVPSRKRRDHEHSLEEAFEKFLSWTTDAQKEELKSLKASGDREAVYAKVMEYFEAAEGETKQKAAEGLKGACKHFATDLFGEAGVAQIKAVKESGASKEAMIEKITELVNGLTDETKKAKAQKLTAGCQKVYEAVPSRKRRDHEHSLEEAFEKFLSWTTDAQKEELKSLKASGDREAVYAKVMEYFEAAEGETKQKAAEGLKGACKHFATDLFGEAGVAQIKAVKESGASKEAMIEKITELVNGLTDETKKAKAQKLTAGCQKVYEAVPSRKRRDHEHSLEEAFEKFLSWTTDAQKEELKSLKASGDREAVYAKVMEYFEAAEGETKQKAAEGLKGACKHFATDLFGEAGVAQIKAVKESGASKEAMIEKITELVNGLTDETKKAKAQKLTAGCQKVYEAVPSRKRRDHEHSLEEAFEKFLSWTTDAQKEELKSLKASGDREAVYAKVMEYFEAAEGETKQKAAEGLKGACKHFATDLFGEAGVAQIKAVKESGASKEAMIEKITELVNGLTDETKKAKAQKLTAGCQKVYEAVPSRKRRDHEHSLEEAFEKFLSWTTDAQKEELKSLKASGDREAVYAKVMEYFEAAEGETKQKAAEGLKGACKHFATDLFGEAGVAQIKAVKESGASKEAMIEKIAELVNGLTDETKKAKAQKLTAGCQKVYEAVPSRKRRDHEHSLEEAFEKFLSWTTDAQKEELKSLKASGDREAVYAKVMEYFEAAEGETKQKAAEGLKGACKHFATDLFGEAGVAQIKAVKESGASKEAMIEKITELVNGLTDETKKAKAQKLTAGCQKVYEAVPSRKRRDHEHSLEEAFEKFLSWTSDAQKEELKSLKASGDREAVYAKVMEYFEAAEGETKQKAAEGLKGACKHFATDLFGEAGVAQIKAVKESGASKEAMIEKITELVNGLTDETKKAKAQKLTAGCQKVYEAVPSRMRRDQHHNFEHDVEKYLSWLSVEQKTELSKIDKTDKKALREKVLSFLDAAEGKTKIKAVTDMKAACKHYSLDIFGEAKTTELKDMRESGSSSEALLQKLAVFIDELNDNVTKEKARDLVEGCKRVYEGTRMRRDSYY